MKKTTYKNEIKTKSLPGYALKQHHVQFDKPHYSTIGLEKFLSKHGAFKKGTSVLDIGCGPGAVTNYMARKHKDVEFLGLDYNKYLIDESREAATKGVPNLKLGTANWFNMPKSMRGKFDGTYNVHAFCMFKEVDEAIDALVKLNPRWIAFNSVFTTGDYDVLIHVRDYHRPHVADDNHDGDFNMFSLKYIKEYLAKKGYKKFYAEPFEIPVSLPRPKNGGRGTYTVKTEMGPRTQFSAEVYLPWYFVMAEK